jgi:hypothetical protein
MPTISLDGAARDDGATPRTRTDAAAATTSANLLTIPRDDTGLLRSPRCW